VSGQHVVLDNEQLRELHRAPRNLAVGMLKSKKLLSAGTLARMVERRNICLILSRKQFGICLLVRRKQRHEDNIKMDL
jgi:hypothetical protein